MIPDLSRLADSNDVGDSAREYFILRDLRKQQKRLLANQLNGQYPNGPPGDGTYGKGRWKQAIGVSDFCCGIFSYKDVFFVLDSDSTVGYKENGEEFKVSLDFDAYNRRRRLACCTILSIMILIFVAATVAIVLEYRALSTP